MGDGVIRKKKGFTAVQNSVARARNLSIKAKGLYVVMQSYITIPDSVWKKSDIEAMCIEGSKQFNSAWSELKEKGYLRTHIFTENGTFRNEYELLDEPEPGPHTYYYNSKGELTKTNEDRYPQNGIYGDGSNGKGSNADGNNGDGYDANGGNNNQIITKTDNNTDINPSINMEERWTEIVSFWKEHGELPYADILESMEGSEDFVDRLVSGHGKYLDDREVIFQTLVRVLKEVLFPGSATVANGRTYTPAKILSLMLRHLEEYSRYPYIGIPGLIDSTIENYRRAAESRTIRNPKEYLKSCFINACISSEIENVTVIAHDFGWDG